MSHLFAMLLADHAVFSSWGHDIFPARLTAKEQTERSEFISIQVHTIAAEILASRQNLGARRFLTFQASRSAFTTLAVVTTWPVCRCVWSAT